MGSNLYPLNHHLLHMIERQAFFQDLDLLNLSIHDRIQNQNQVPLPFHY